MRGPYRQVGARYSFVMADPLDLLGPWRGVLNQVRGAAAPITGASEDAVRQLLAPVTVMLDLLEQSAAAMRTQAQAFNAAAASFKQAADLLELQAELLERAGESLRDPTQALRAAGGRGRPTRSTATRVARSASSYAARSRPPSARCS